MTVFKYVCVSVVVLGDKKVSVDESLAERYKKTVRLYVPYCRFSDIPLPSMMQYSCKCII